MNRSNFLDCYCELLAMPSPIIWICINPDAADIGNDKSKFSILAEALHMLPGGASGKFARNTIISNKKISLSIPLKDQAESLHAIEKVFESRMYPFGSRCADIIGFVNHYKEAICAS